MYSQKQLKDTAGDVAKDVVDTYAPSIADLEAKEEVASYNNWQNNKLCPVGFITQQGFTRTAGQRGAYQNRGVINFFADATYTNEGESERSFTNGWAVSWQFYDSQVSEEWLPYFNNILCKDGKMCSDDSHNVPLAADYWPICNVTVFVNGVATPTEAQYRDRCIHVRLDNYSGTIAAGESVNFDVQFAIPLRKNA